ncbi:PIP5K9, partial [Symbiodinium sp. CCMP2456]
MAGYKTASHDKFWSRPTTWPARKSVPRRVPDAPHVVPATKFQEPCGVEELYKEKANDRWLRTFCENLDKIQREKKGFVLQIQQGVVREKSDMQIAEERMGKMWSVPRIVEKAHKQWEQRDIKDEAEMVSECFEPLEGDTELPLNDEGKLEGLPAARSTPPADWQNGKQGTNRFASGEVYPPCRLAERQTRFADGTVHVGEYQNDQLHGWVTLRFASGEVGFHERDKPNGRSVKLSASRTKAWLYMDGKDERQVSVVS